MSHPTNGRRFPPEPLGTDEVQCEVLGMQARGTRLYRAPTVERNGLGKQDP